MALWVSQLSNIGLELQESECENGVSWEIHQVQRPIQMWLTEGFVCSTCRRLATTCKDVIFLRSTDTFKAENKYQTV